MSPASKIANNVMLFHDDGGDFVITLLSCFWFESTKFIISVEWFVGMEYLNIDQDWFTYNVCFTWLVDWHIHEDNSNVDNCCHFYS